MMTLATVLFPETATYPTAGPMTTVSVDAGTPNGFQLPGTSNFEFPTPLVQVFVPEDPTTETRASRKIVKTGIMSKDDLCLGLLSLLFQQEDYCRTSGVH